MTNSRFGEREKSSRSTAQYDVRRPFYSFSISLLLLVLALTGSGALLIVLSQSRPQRAPPVLASAIEFRVSGSVSNLIPGVPAPLVISLQNPFSVRLTLLSITVTEAPTPSVPVVPRNCPGSDLELVEGSSMDPLRGSTARATWSFAPLQPVIAANSSSPLSLLSVVLARDAGNSCQHVTFPLDYTAIADEAIPSATTSTTQATSVQTSSTVVPAPLSAAPAPSTVVPAHPTGPLPATGTQVVELVCGGLALLLAGTLVVLMARRPQRGQTR